MKTRIIMGIALLSFLVWNPYPLQVLELKTFDWLMSTKPVVQDELIILVDIDEEFVEAVGGYPIPRRYYGDLITRTEAIPGITVLMPDPDLRGDNEDYLLAYDLSQIPTILAYTASTQATEGGPHVGTAALGENPRPWLYQYPGILRQLPALADQSAGVGLITTAPEIDGVVRRIPLVVNVEDKLYTSFALEMLRVATGNPSYQISTKETGVEWIRLPEYPLINTDPRARVWTTWNTKFYRQSAAEYLREPLQGATFVIFGVTAEGVANPIPTPNGSRYAHEVQANVLHGLLSGDSPAEPSWAFVAELGATTLVLLILAFATYSIYFSLPILVGVIFTLCYGAWQFFQQGLLLDVSGTILVVSIFWSVVTFRNFVQQFLLRRQIKGQFGTYLSPDMVDMLVKDPSLMKLGGERKEMTFLFADIVGFTPISESYMKKDDPEGLVELINLFLDRMTKVILANGGTIDKYMGDCVMAFWNAPLPCENHAEMALKSAMQIELLTEQLNKELKEQGLDLPPVVIGTGINTGPCIVGNMGSESRFDYSVVGDAVNLGARLEVQTRTYDTPILISAYTHAQLETIECVRLDEIKVKGKDEPVEIFAPLFGSKIRKLQKT
jgi:adenylate cyclase